MPMSFLHSFRFVSYVSKAVAAYMYFIITRQSRNALYLKHIYINYSLLYITLMCTLIEVLYHRLSVSSGRAVQCTF